MNKQTNEIILVLNTAVLKRMNKGRRKSEMNKAGNTAIQSWTVGQEQERKNRSQFNKAGYTAIQSRTGWQEPGA